MRQLVENSNMKQLVEKIMFSGLAFFWNRKISSLNINLITLSSLAITLKTSYHLLKESLQQLFLFFHHIKSRQPHHHPTTPHTIFKNQTFKKEEDKKLKYSYPSDQNYVSGISTYINSFHFSLLQIYRYYPSYRWESPVAIKSQLNTQESTSLK